MHYLQNTGMEACRISGLCSAADKEGTIFCHFGEKEQKYDKIIGSYESLEMPCPAKCLSFIKYKSCKLV